MCSISGIIFAVLHMELSEVEGKRVLEVGALDVNGSLRPILHRLHPAEYIGVDLVPGRGVDQICRVEDLEKTFGKDSFDLVVATELLEHVCDWPQAVSNLKRVCKPGGIILITTRAPGFRYHGYPDDYWRYDVDDIRHIFSDFYLMRLESDPDAPGVFFKGKKPLDFHENNLSEYPLFSILLNKKATKLSDHELKRLSRRLYRKNILRRKILHAVMKALYLGG